MLLDTVGIYLVRLDLRSSRDRASACLVSLTRN